ncbi:MAG: ATP-binding protein [Desulfuromonadaceae bacterium]|nr:ATP-binding protein [Desulfuromonadaceae bacterium]
MTFQLSPEDHRIVFKIVAIYSLFGGLWIYLSDFALGLLVRDPDIITHIATYKGLLFIAITATLLYYLIGRYICRLSETSRQIAANEEELRSLLELMPVGVAWSDDNGTIKYINQNFIENFGYTLTDIPTVEAWFLKAYPESAYRQEVVSVWNASIADYRAHRIPVPPSDVKVTCKNGLVRRVIINTQMSQNRTLVIFTDITERESQQDELIKKQKLESIGVLAGGIAHDFNNILTAILGNISFASMFIGHNDKAEAPLLQAEKATKRAAELAHQLLTFAKGGQPLTRSVAPRQLIEDSLSLVLRGSTVQSSVEIPEGLHSIEADAGQISQAFNNLIINAVQAMPGGGTLSIQTENVSFDTTTNPFALPAGEYVSFKFSDEGCGIPVETLKNIFDPYFTTKPGGSGLGLASVQSIVSKHGGHISVTSAVNSGTTFKILLPASKDSVLVEETLSREIVTDRLDTGSQASILVMDDEKILRDLAVTMLGELGYRVTTSADGDEAVTLYKSALESGTAFSAVIMDLTIPGAMGGQEAAQAILAIDPHAQLIVSSGYSNDPVMADFQSYGFSAVVFKPYSVTDIAGVLNTLLKTGIAQK